MSSDDAKEGAWRRRRNWSKCREPFKTELDTIASHWIEGEFTNEQLALEMWQMWSKLRFAEGARSAMPIPLPDVRGQIDILAEALSAAALYPSTTAAERLLAIETAMQLAGQHNGPQR